LFIEPTKQLFFIGFGLIGLWLMVKFLYGSLSRVVIYFDANCEVTITKYLLNSKYASTKLTHPDLYLLPARSFSFVPFARSLQLQTKSQKCSIAQLLTPAENNWLKSEIASYLVGIASAVKMSTARWSDCTRSLSKSKNKASSGSASG
jgi:hypothetical protein